MLSLQYLQLHRWLREKQVILKDTNTEHWSLLGYTVKISHSCHETCKLNARDEGETTEESVMLQTCVDSTSSAHVHLLVKIQTDIIC